MVNAPHLVPANEEDATEQRGWWFSQPHDYFKGAFINHVVKKVAENSQKVT